MTRRHGKQRYYSLESFFSYMRLYRWRFALVLLSFIIANIALVVIPLFIGRLIGDLSATPQRGHSAVINVWFLIGLSSAHNVMWRASEYLHMKFITPLSFEYEHRLFNEVVRKPYPYFVDKFTGKISSYIGTVTQEMREFFDNLTYNYVSQVISLIGILAILTSINWQTGLIFAIGMALMLGVGRLSIRNSSHYEKLSADVQSTKNARIIDAIANFVNVKSFQKERLESKTIQDQEVIATTAAFKSSHWTIFFWATMSFFIRDVIWPLTITYNVYLFFHHELSIGQLATVLSTLLIFSSTVWELIWYVSQFNLRLARAEEAHRYLFGPVNIVKQRAVSESRGDIHCFNNALKINKLSFSYPDKPETVVLHDITLSLKAGEKIGIVGHSGSGKTTLTKLLLGYYPVQRDELLLDGQAVDSHDLATLISYVPQDTSLFHRTIAENIAYAADSESSQAQIVAAAKRAHAHEFIAQIDDGYNALVGERGVKLSAGQRQRIAIARALLDDKPILIMDEATSALDSESEILVQQALEELWEQKTVIAIAHRLSTLRHMDRIIVMDDGRIIEEGTHAQLLKTAGAYAKLWNHQSGGFLED